MAGRKRLPDIMGEALGWLQNESPIIKANGALAEVEMAANPEPLPGAKVLTMHQPAQGFDPALVAKLDALNLKGMSQALKELCFSPRTRVMSFEELLTELVTAEEAARAQRRFLNRLGKARIPYGEAGIQDFNFGSGQLLNRAQLAGLAGCEWLRGARDLVVRGVAGSGKTLMASIVARAACEQGYSVLYRRLGSLMRELAEARKDERRFARLRRTYLRADLLVLDDWGVERLPSWQSLDLFELLEGRHGQGSTMIVTRLPRDKWLDIFDEAPQPGPVLSDLFYNAVERLAKGAIRMDMADEVRAANAAE